MVDNERVKELFLDLVRINGTSGEEREVADYVKAKLESIGFEVEEDDAGAKIDGSAGNVIAFMRGTAPGAKAIFLCSHMDTVEPTRDLTPVMEGGAIRSDGTTILGADDRAGIAAVIEGVRSVVEQGTPHGDIQVLFNVSEENGLLGAKMMDHGRIRARMGYVFDTQRPVAGITVSAPSHSSMRIEITGKAAHAGIAPEKGVNAIVAASNAISKMKLGRIDEETTANVGVISGGKARNIVPDHLLVKAEARSRSEAKLHDQVEHMVSLFEEEAERIGARAVVEVTREYSAYRFTQEDEVIKLAMAASRRLGIEPTFHEGGGGSDANVFNAEGIPSVVVGVGYENAHSSSEFITVEDLVTAAEFAAALVQVAGETEG